MATDINLTPTAGMPPITTETSTTGRSSGAEAIIPSPESQLAQQQALASSQAVAGAEAAVNPALAATVEGKATGIDAQQALVEAQNAERSRLIAERMPAIKAAQTETKKAEDSYANHQFYDLLAQRSSGDKILSRIAIALNAGANAYLGIPGNELAEELQHRVDQDFEKQKVQLHSKEQIAKWKKEGVVDLYDQLQKELAAVDVKHAKALEATKMKAESMALRAGVPEMQAKQNVVTAKMQEAADTKRMEAMQRLDRHISSRSESGKSASTTSAKGGGGGGVEADRAAAQFDLLKENGTWLASKMPKLTPTDVTAINRAIDGNTLRESWPATAAALAQIGIDPEKSVSPEAKEYINRVARASAALGRLDSGAAIGTVENIRFVDNFRPRVTDTPADAANRAEQIAKDIELRGGHLARPSRNAAVESATSDMVWIKSNTGNRKQVTREEAKRLGALK